MVNERINQRMNEFIFQTGTNNTLLHSIVQCADYFVEALYDIIIVWVLFTWKSKYGCQFQQFSALNDITLCFLLSNPFQAFNGPFKGRHSHLKGQKFVRFPLEKKTFKIGV